MGTAVYRGWVNDFLLPPSEHDILRPMARCFNIAGFCIPAKHYMLPALNRQPGVWRLIAREQYFVVHAPRQAGKTTAFEEAAPPRRIVRSHQL